MAVEQLGSPILKQARTFGTGLDKQPTPQKSQAQLNCEAKGGRWNEVNKKCILPTATRTPTPKIDEPRIFTEGTGERDAQGNLIRGTKQTGITIDGKTFLGINQKDIDLLLQQKQEETQRPSSLLLEKQRQLSPQEQFKQNIREQAKQEVLPELLPEEIPTSEREPSSKQNTITDTELRNIPLNERPKQIGLGGKEILAPQLTADETRVFGKENISKTLNAFALASGFQALDEAVAFAKGGIPAWRVGTKTFTNSRKAIKSGTQVQNAKIAKPLLTQLKEWGIGLLAGVTGLKIIGIDLLEGKIPAQQQAINTIGQTASTIAGQVKTGQMDSSEGLQQVRDMERVIFELERNIKMGGISNLRLRFSGNLFDLEADLLDQKLTLQEARNDINEFRIAGQFPELSPFQVNELLNELEAEGIIVRESFVPTPEVFR